MAKIDAIQALVIANLAIEGEMGRIENKLSGNYRELFATRKVLVDLRRELEMNASSDLNFFRRTKATMPVQPQAPEMPDSVKKQLEQLAARFAQLKEAIQLIEARLTALESGQTEEKKIKANGHNVRSFQADIVNHSKGVRK